MEDRRGDDRDRDRSPLRSEEHCESSDQSDGKKKLAFGFGKKTGNEQKKGIQIKLGSVSVSKKKIVLGYAISFLRNTQFFF